MDKEVIVERHILETGDGGSSTGSNAIWAIAFVIVVAIIAGAVYYSGILRRIPPAAPSKVNVEVQQAPAQQAPAQPAPAQNK